MTGKWPTEQIDHKNHNGEDNRWENLREATHTQNMRNRITSKNSTTGVCGVNQCLSYSRSPTGQPKFRAVIRINYKNKHLGFFNTLDEAAAARKAAEKKYLGKFAPE